MNGISLHTTLFLPTIFSFLPVPSIIRHAKIPISSQDIHRNFIFNLASSIFKYSQGFLFHIICISPAILLIYIYIYIYGQHFFIDTNFVEHNRYFLSTYFLVDPFILAVLLLSFSAGIDWCIFHNCIYPKYFLSVFGPSSEEDLLQKWCNFCFCITFRNMQPTLNRINFQTSANVLKCL